MSNTDLSSCFACDVVIPYHPPAVQWVFAAVESILNQQAVRCVTHVLGDDVAMDVHRDLMSKFEGAPDIIFYHNPEAIGPFRSYHKAFSNFKTDFSGFQASDDIAMPHRFHHSIECLERTGCEIFTAAMENFVDWRSHDKDFLRERVRKMGMPEVSGVIEMGSPGGKMISGTMTVRNDTFKRLNGFADWLFGADAEFAERARKAGASVYVSDSVVLLRRMHDHSLFHNKNHGYKTPKRIDRSNEIQRRYALFEKEFDPAAFGSLHKYR